MAEFLHPDVFLEEVDSPVRPIEGVSTSMAAFVGTTERGPMGEAVLITSLDQAFTIFGPHIATSYLMYGVEAFFKEGGSRCYVIRTAHYTTISDPSSVTALKSHLDLLNEADSPVATFLDVDAESEGLWGDDVTISVQHDPRHPSQGAGADLETTVAIGATTAQITVGAGRGVGLAKYSVVKFTTGGTNEWVVLDTVDRDTGIITWTGGLASEFTSAAAEIRSEEFTVRIYESGILKETYVSLSNQPLAANFVDTALNDEVLGSVLVDWTTGVPSSVEDTIPAMDAVGAASLTQRALTAGNDGLTSLTSTDYIGNIAAQNGIRAADPVLDSLQLCIPGHTAMNETERIAISKAMITYAEGRRDVFCILDPPDNKTVAAMSTFRNITAGYDSSFAAIYYPWVKISDPIGNGRAPSIFVPPSGHMAGIYARQDNRPAPSGGVWTSPGGEQASVFSALGLRTLVSDADQDSLNPDHVNAIRTFPGKGVKVWGVRTLSSNANLKYIQTRRFLIFVGKSLRSGLMFSVFRNIDTPLFSQVSLSVEGFLRVLHGQGALRGNVSSDAFFVKCDERNNRTETVELGRLIIEIGLATQRPAEFVILRISQGVDISLIQEMFG